MTIINTNSISGINSITAQGASGIEFYESSGVNQRLHITSAGDMGLGTGSPTNISNFTSFTLSGTTGGNIEFKDDNVLRGSVYNLADQFIVQAQGSSTPLAFRTNSTERISITSDGLVDISGGVQISENITPTSGAGLELFREGGGGGQIQAFDRSGSAWLPLILKGSTQSFYTSGTERLHITSGGNVGINDASPSDALTVYKNNIGNPSGITIRNTEASSTYSHARLRLESQNGAAYGEIWADVANAGLRLGYNSSSTVKIDSAGNIVLLSGKGIDFSATDNGNGTMASELLNDYETGDWTPTIEGINGASGQTYAGSTRGSYTKVGRLVVVSFYCEASVIGTLSGANLVISGLPYNVENEVGAGAGNIAYFSGLANNVSAVMANARNNTDDFFINHVVAAGAAAAVNSTNIATNGVRFDGVFTYRTTS